jgi:hypothetical protein
MRNYAKRIEEFIFYVNSFYNEKDGIYPIATKERIAEAVNIYLESKPLGQIYFDSFDRESVRQIIQPEYQQKQPINK